MTGPDHIISNPTNGLTKREYFAGLALQGLLTLKTEDYDYINSIEVIAVAFADDLIAALNQRD